MEKGDQKSDEKRVITDTEVRVREESERRERERAEVESREGAVPFSFVLSEGGGDMRSCRMTTTSSVSTVSHLLIVHSYGLFFI